MAALTGAAAGAPPSPQSGAASERLFREQVRPVLVARCLGCHAGSAPQGDLDLSIRETLTAARTKTLLQRVQDGSMPPKGKLPAAEVATLRQWVDAGLPWSDGRIDPLAYSTEQRAGLDWWSLQPLRPVPTPTNHGSALDAFIGSRLRKAGLDFAPEASPATLIRRVTYDLTGLAPTPEEVAAFVKEYQPPKGGSVQPQALRSPTRRSAPKAQRLTPNALSLREHASPPTPYERLVDRLLSSPRFGERMARRWLDIVRFAESDGYEHDDPRPKAWPYRDWVIDAFNRDLPYDQFLREQIAGDALHPDDPRGGVPTGFLVAGGYDDVGAKQAAENFRLEVRQDELEDMIGTTLQVTQGMTAQCARCHDHKFDPIPQQDYYRLQAALAGAQHYPPAKKPEFYAVRSDAPPQVWLLQRGSVTARGPEVTPGALSGLRALPADLGSSLDDDRTRRLKLAAWLTDARNPLTPRVMTNRVWSWFFGQGLVNTPNDFGFNGDRPSHPELLEYLAARFSSGEGRVERGEGGTARLSTLSSPLSPMGAGRVERREGKSTSLSTLSSPLSTTGAWSIKRLVRALVLSRTYRQSAAGNAKAAAKDAGNRLLWRHTPRRLESEELRDTLLQAAGKLNLTMGGPGFQLFTAKDNAGVLYEPADRDGDEFRRRAIYRMVVRGTEDPLLSSFDCPDASNTTPRRLATTTATQALSLLNNGFVDRQSGYLAERLAREAHTPGEQVRLSYRYVLGRDPLPTEATRAAQFAGQHGLKAWCRILFNTSEFLYVE